MAQVLVSVFIASRQMAPEEIVLDIDSADPPLHRKQESRRIA